MSIEQDSIIREMTVEMMRQKEFELTLKREIESMSIKKFHAEQQRDEYRKVIDELIQVINNTGPVPRYHYHIIKKHREEWPMFWEKIDKLARLKI